jgi:2-methylcitrate dehydratase PrpD
VSITEQLVNYAEKLKFEHLPRSVVDTVKRGVLNNLSAVVAGSSTDVCVDLVHLLKEWGGKPEGTIFLHGAKVPLPNAAWVNSAMARGCDFDDVHQRVGHVNAAVIPAAFALAEYSRAFKNKVISGRDFIVAVALSAELACRLKLAGGQGIITRNWLAEPFNCLAVAALGGKLLGLGSKKTQNALGIAFFQCFGNIGAASGGGAGKMASMGQGLATKSGVLSVILADKGFAATNDILREDVGGWSGFYSVYGDGKYDSELLGSDLGKRYESLCLFTKTYPGCTVTQSTIQGVLELARENNIRAKDIAKVIFRVSEDAYLVCGKGKGKPSSIVEALWNYPYSAAVALVKGEVFIDDFTEEAFRNPQVLELVERVDIEVDPDQDAASGSSFGSSQIEIKTKDDKSYRKVVDYARGHPMHPMSMSELAEKFKRCTRFSVKPLPEQSVEHLVQEVNELEDMHDVTKIVDILS